MQAKRLTTERWRGIAERSFCATPGNETEFYSGLSVDVTAFALIKALCALLSHCPFTGVAVVTTLFVPSSIVDVKRRFDSFTEITLAGSSSQ